MRRFTTSMVVTRCATRRTTTRGGGARWRRATRTTTSASASASANGDADADADAARRAGSSSSASSSSSGGGGIGGGGETVSVGELHVITGPMFAGKTSALVRRVDDERARGRAVFVAKSALDVRYGDATATMLTTHDGKRAGGAHPVRDLMALTPDARAALAASDVVAIDEAQFLANLVTFVKRCVERDGKTVYVAGLDGDFKRERFGDVLDLLPMCDSVTRLKGRCSTCGADSLFSLRTTTIPTDGDTDDDDDDDDDEEKVVIGGADKYAPACRRCYVAHAIRTTR